MCQGEDEEGVEGEVGEWRKKEKRELLNKCSKGLNINVKVNTISTYPCHPM